MTNESPAFSYMISDKRNVSLGFIDCSPYTLLFALKDQFLEKKMDMLLFFSLNTTSCGLWQRRSPYLPDKAILFKKTFLTILQFVKLPLQWKQSLHSMDRILKISSGVGNSS